MTRKNYGLRAVAALIVFIMLSAFIPVNNVDATTPDQMNISENGLQFIINQEGFDSTCFWDYAQWTIGYGTKCDGSGHPSNPSNLQKGPHTITKDAAKTKFESAIKNTYVPGVRRQLSEVNMNQNQFDALVSLCYNAGEGRVKNSPLAKYLRGEMTKEQAYSEYCNYVVTAGGQVLQGLKNRRKLEADMFFSGESENFFDFWGVDDNLSISGSYKIWFKQVGLGDASNSAATSHQTGKIALCLHYKRVKNGFKFRSGQITSAGKILRGFFI